MQKLILNVLLYLAQLMFLKIGGQIKVGKQMLIFEVKEGRHWEIPKKLSIREFRGYANSV